METKFKPNYAIHPGILLNEEIKDLGYTQKEVAIKTGIPKTVINEIIKGKRNINADIAVKLESALESSAKFWLKCQLLYDEVIARIKLNKQQICVEDDKVLIYGKALTQIVYEINNYSFKESLEAA